MASVLIVFGTGEGQTAKVADRIVERLGGLGHTAEAFNVNQLPDGLDLAGYDAVLIGASIHMGRHQKAVRRFVSANREVLETRPTGFFQVSGSSGEGTQEGAAEAAGYVDEFIEATGWRPDRIGLFGGALRFSEYGFLMRGLVKFVARADPSGTNPLADVEYTDWEEVEAFADEFAAFVEQRVGEPAGATRTPHRTA